MKSGTRLGHRATCILLLAGWCALVVVVLGVAAMVERNRLLDAFSAQVAILHRQLSQRVDQHDAHLTALSAVATTDEANRSDVFREVADTIVRFYPRITAVDLVPLNDGRTLSTRADAGADLKQAIRNAALASAGKLILLPTPGAPGSYLLVKRSPNTDLARYGIALEIEGDGLFEGEPDFWTQASVDLSLLLPDGTPLVGGQQTGSPQFEKELGSQSQPLLLQASFEPELADVLPPGRAVAVAVLATLAYVAFVLGLGQYARARRAERQAYFSAQEARLAHASRVNVLGEMASGMAHELTQPLTAILSQAQAGRHLARRGDATALEPVMQQIVDQAKRASSILESLSNWTKASQPLERSADVIRALDSVELLLSPEAQARKVELTFGNGTGAVWVGGDQVEVEQIIFNIARNGLEAASGVAGAGVTVAVDLAGDTVVIDVSDTGPGVPAELRHRLFEPFVTGKLRGTGLGLALCQRLAERMGGEVILLDGLPTVFRVILPRLSSPQNEVRR